MNSDQEQFPQVERFWSAKEWSRRSGIPYRAVLEAAARGDLAALRPSRSAHGAVLISESSWTTWLEGSRMQTRISRPLTRGCQDLSELAIGRPR